MSEHEYSAQSSLSREAIQKARMTSPLAAYGEGSSEDLGKTKIFDLYSKTVQIYLAS